MGNCYKVDSSFIVIQPLIALMGGSGFYSDKAAKVTLIDSKGQAKVLYRAIDNWHELKPPRLDWKQVETRTNNLRSLGTDAIGKPIDEVFGTEDSRMGSGMDYRIF